MLLERHTISIGKRSTSSLIIKGEMEVFLNHMLPFSLLPKWMLPNAPHPQPPAYFITGMCLAGPGDITTFLFAIFTGPNKVLLKYRTT